MNADLSPGHSIGMMRHRMSTRNPDKSSSEGDEVVLARRKLLKAAIYAAPLVVSAVVVDRAAAQPTPSCGPATCTPNDGPCGPANCPPEA